MGWLGWLWWGCGVVGQYGAQHSTVPRYLLRKQRGSVASGSVAGRCHVRGPGPGTRLHHQPWMNRASFPPPLDHQLVVDTNAGSDMDRYGPGRAGHLPKTPQIAERRSRWEAGCPCATTTPVQPESPLALHPRSHAMYMEAVGKQTVAGSRALSQSTSVPYQTVDHDVGWSGKVSPLRGRRQTHFLSLSPFLVFRLTTFAMLPNTPSRQPCGLSRASLPSMPPPPAPASPSRLARRPQAGDGNPDPMSPCEHGRRTRSAD